MYMVIYVDKNTGKIKTSADYSIGCAFDYADELKKAGHIKVEIYSKNTKRIIK